MSQCNRFEKEGLLILQKGGQLDEHFSSCQACIDARQKYESLENLILSADSTSVPAAGWQERVLESVEKQPSGWKGFWPKSIAAGFAAIMVTGVLVNQYATNSRSPAGLEIMLASSGQTYRGAAAKIGDTMQISAPGTEAKFIQIRIYRDGRLFDYCGIKSPCELVEGVAIRATKLSALGDYQTVLIQSDKGIEFSSNRLEQDVILAHENVEAQVSLGKVITVR